MSYYNRIELLEDGATFHATWRCHNKEFFIKGDFEKKLYYDLLVKYKNDYNLVFYSYSIMSNHIHLLGKCIKVYDLSNFFRKVNSIFARAINERTGHCGQVIMDRYKSPMIESNEGINRVARYIDINAYKAKMVKHPRFYKWCSYNYYAFGKEDKLLTTSPAYIEFGGTDAERRKNYIAMVEELVDNEPELKKENYSLCYYIGDPDWVLAKYEALKNKRKERFLKYTEPIPS